MYLEFENRKMAGVTVAALWQVFVDHALNSVNDRMQIVRISRQEINNLKTPLIAIAFEERSDILKFQASRE